MNDVRNTGGNMQSHKLYPEVPDSLWRALGRGRVKKGGCGDVLLKLVLVVKAVRDGVGYFQTRPSRAPRRPHTGCGC